MDAATQPDADGFTHGVSAYHNRRCRCRTCRDANNAYMRAYKKSLRDGIVGGPTAPIRTWARANGYRVSDYGKIPHAVADAYAAAHR